MVRQDWCAVTFVHWGYPPDLVQALLPDDLTVHTADGLAWVTLTPFDVERLRPPIGPPVPGVARFAETNLRTYVVAADGSDGLHFLDIEASNAAVSWTIRAAFGLPYRVSKMGASAATRQHHGHHRYIANRATPAGDIGHDLAIEAGAPLPDRRGEAALDDWLVGRWRAFGTALGRRIAIDVEHQPWTLHHASLLRCQEDLLRAAGLPSPSSPALVRYSPGVAVALSFPRLVRAAR